MCRTEQRWRTPGGRAISALVSDPLIRLSQPDQAEVVAVVIHTVNGVVKALTASFLPT
jgi:hypothetical protein